MLEATSKDVQAPAGATGSDAERPARMRWAIVAAVVSVAALALLSPSYSLASTVLIYAIAVLGCNLLLGYTGLLPFGQGVFFGVGAYAAGLSFVHLEFQVPAGLAIAMLVGMVVAAAVGSLCILQRGVSFVMLTFAFAMMFGHLVYVFSDITGGENGLRGFPGMSFGFFGSRLMALNTSQAMLGVIAVCFVAVYILLTRVVRSRFGATLMAIRENEDRAAAIGYNTTLFKLMAFVLSGLVTGLAGGLYAMHLGTVPDTALQLDISVTILIMTILGGTGSLYGSFLGAVVYLLLTDYLSQVWDRWQILLAIALIAIVLFLRGGLWGAIEIARSEIGHRAGRRRRRGAGQ